MSQTCHCCNQFSGDCNFDFCSPWIFSMRGPSPINQQPFYNDDFYSFSAEFEMNSFIWSLKPKLNCSNSIYKESNNNLQLMMSKVFYIDPNKNINVNFMIENKQIDLMYKIQMKSLLPQCFYCRNSCSSTGAGISYNYPINTDCFNVNNPCSYLYYDIRTMSNVPSFLNNSNYLPNRFRIADCSKVYNERKTLSFNTSSRGPFWLLTLYISKYEILDAYQLGYETTGAINIDGITSATCSRFSKLMITSEEYNNKCFVSSFYTDGTIDTPPINRSKVMNWGENLNDNGLESGNCNLNQENLIFCDDDSSFYINDVLFPMTTIHSYGHGNLYYKDTPCYPMIPYDFD